MILDGNSFSVSGARADPFFQAGIDLIDQLKRRGFLPVYRFARVGLGHRIRDVKDTARQKDIQLFGCLDDIPLVQKQDTFAVIHIPHQRFSDLDCPNLDLNAVAQR